MEWYAAIEQVSSHVVRILTPQGAGTGFLVDLPNKKKLCGIATASHVVSHAHLWESPIRIIHHSSGKDTLLHFNERAIILNEANDTAMVVFDPGDIPFPTEALSLTPEKKYVKPGVEIGWLGFPSVAPDNLCFFSGRVSLWQKGKGYLVDGVAINGVSGGPAFHGRTDSVSLAGVVSAYIPNQSTGVYRDWETDRKSVV